jgi:hypothetical protein
MQGPLAIVRCFSFEALPPIKLLSMSRATLNQKKVSPALLSKATHALGLEQAVPRNGGVCPVQVWEELVEHMGRAANCPARIIGQAKTRYTYYMLYHYAPGV